MVPGRASFGGGSDFGVSEDFCTQTSRRERAEKKASGHVTRTAIIGWGRVSWVGSGASEVV